jgi:hypothetical protein
MFGQQERLFDQFGNGWLVPGSFRPNLRQDLFVIPAKAGTHILSIGLDPRFCGDDECC